MVLQSPSPASWTPPGFCVRLTPQHSLALLSVPSKHMNAFIEDILRQIQDLLELSPPVSVDAPSETGDPFCLLTVPGGIRSPKAMTPPVNTHSLFKLTNSQPTVNTHLLFKPSNGQHTYYSNQPMFNTHLLFKPTVNTHLLFKQSNGQHTLTVQTIQRSTHTYYSNEPMFNTHLLFKQTNGQHTLIIQPF